MALQRSNRAPSKRIHLACLALGGMPIKPFYFLVKVAFLLCIANQSWSAPDDAKENLRENLRENFKTGPVFTDFGKHTAIESSMKLSVPSAFKVAFDVSKKGENNSINRQFESLARFINMHVANKVDLADIQLALVVHGKANYDLLNNRAYRKKFKQDNPNTKLINQLSEIGKIDVIVCGQSSSYMNLTRGDFNKHVTIALSAMTAHAALQANGYSLNPF